MSIFTINSYLLPLTAKCLWIYIPQLPCLYPITCAYLKICYGKNEIPCNNSFIVHSTNTLQRPSHSLFHEVLCNNPFNLLHTQWSFPGFIRCNQINIWNNIICCIKLKFGKCIFTINRIIH